MFSIYIENRIHRIKGRICRVPFQIRNWFHLQWVLIQLSYWRILRDLNREYSIVRYLGWILFRTIIALGWITVFFTK